MHRLTHLLSTRIFEPVRSRSRRGNCHVQITESYKVVFSPRAQNYCVQHTCVCIQHAPGCVRHSQFLIQEQLLRKNVKRFRGIQGSKDFISRLESNKKEEKAPSTRMGVPTRSTRAGLVLKSQPLPKNVNLLFTIANQNTKLTVLTF